MKMGIRKPSIKKSISARTTGKIKRQMKSTVNPLYGKKGMGVVNNPKKAVYNKVYNKTTVDVSDLAKGGSTKNSGSADMSDIELAFTEKIEQNVYAYSPKTYRVCSALMKILGIIAAVIIGLPCLFIGMVPVALIVFAITFVCFWFAKGMKKTAKEIEERNTSE